MPNASLQSCLAVALVQPADAWTMPLGQLKQQWRTQAAG